MTNNTYEEFIQNILDTRGRFACGDEYHERHHITPRCMGGGDDEENLIDLFAREHFVAHKLLAKENPDNDKLIYAWSCMGFVKNDSQERYELSPMEYEEVRVAFSKTKKGKPLSEEHRRNISNATRGHFVSESTRRAIAKANANRVWDRENHPLLGTHRTAETKAKLSESCKGLRAGEANPRAKITVQFDKDDNLIKVWKYAKLASKVLNIDLSYICACANGRHQSAGGYHWKYLYDNELKNGKTIMGAISLGLITEAQALNLLEQNEITNEEE